MPNEELNTTKKVIDEIKKIWGQTGVTIMSNCWIDIKSRSIINILINGGI